MHPKTDFFLYFFLCTVNIQSINKRKNTYNLAHMVFRSNRNTFLSHLKKECRLAGPHIKSMSFEL